MEKIKIKQLKRGEETKLNVAGWFFENHNTLNFATGTSRKNQTIVYKCEENHLTNLRSHTVESDGSVIGTVECEKCKKPKALQLQDWKKGHSKKAGENYICKSV